MGMICCEMLDTRISHTVWHAMEAGGRGLEGKQHCFHPRFHLHHLSSLHDWMKSLTCANCTGWQILEMCQLRTGGPSPHIVLIDWNFEKKIFVATAKKGIETLCTENYSRFLIIFQTRDTYLLKWFLWRTGMVPSKCIYANSSSVMTFLWQQPASICPRESDYASWWMIDTVYQFISVSLHTWDTLRSGLFILEHTVSFARNVICLWVSCCPTPPSISSLWSLFSTTCPTRSLPHSKSFVTFPPAWRLPTFAIG